MFSRLKSHDNPSRSVYQTSSNIQVLCQHDLKSSKVLKPVLSPTDKLSDTRSGFLPELPL